MQNQKHSNSDIAQNTKQDETSLDLVLSCIRKSEGLVAKET